MQRHPTMRRSAGNAARGIALEAARTKGFGDAARRIALTKAFQALAASRPTAVNLFWALERIQRAVDAHRGDGTALAARLARLAVAIHAEDIRINRAMGRHGAPLIARAAKAGISNAWVDETRPFLQGARLTAWELMQDDIPVTLITDNMAAHFMQRGEVDAVVVGTDRVAANGDIANKIGTYGVAVLARAHRIPFYVACPLSPVDVNTSHRRHIPIEERGRDEVIGHAGKTWAPRDVRVANPAFDVTPARLVTALITGRGVVRAPNAAKIKALMHDAD